MHLFLLINSPRRNLIHWEKNSLKGVGMDKQLELICIYACGGWSKCKIYTPETLSVYQSLSNKSWPISYSELLYKLDQDFLDIQ